MKKLITKGFVKVGEKLKKVIPTSGHYFLQGRKKFTCKKRLYLEEGNINTMIELGFKHEYY